VETTDTPVGTKLSGPRRIARALGVITLAFAGMSMVANALTLGDLEVPSSEATAVPEIVELSWIAAVLCAVVLSGVGFRRVTTPRRPGLPVLWTAGLLAVASTYLVHTATAALWV
jgi:hypothetical protein